MIITPDMEYPVLCIGVGRSYDVNQMKLDVVNLNSSASWFNDGMMGDGTDTVIPRYEHLDLVCVKQIDKETILVCHDSMFPLLPMIFISLTDSLISYLNN